MNIKYRATEQILRATVNDRSYQDNLDTSQPLESSYCKEPDASQETDQKDLYSNKNLSEAIRERLFSEASNLDINQFEKV